jgi:hypothetical protein
MEIQCKSSVVEFEFLQWSSGLFVEYANYLTVNALFLSADCSWLLMDHIKSSPHYESIISIF